jgi:hypothetical protein
MDLHTEVKKEVVTTYGWEVYDCAIWMMIENVLSFHRI